MTASNKMPTDERFFLTFVALGAVVMAFVVGFITLRARHADTNELLATSAHMIAAGTNSRGHLIDFNLTDRTGRTVSRADLEGQFLVVNFIFTSCSPSCLQVSRHMAEIQQLVADQPDVRLVSLSVDPRNDTLSTLVKFAEQFGADTNRWLFLTDGQKPACELIEKSFLGSRSTNSNYRLQGGWARIDYIVLVDRQGQLRGRFDGLKSSTPKDVVLVLEQLRLRTAR